MNVPHHIKRLILLFGVIAVIGLLRSFWGPPYDAFFSELLTSQRKNLRRVDEHIKALGPRWKDFTNQNAGFELVSLFAYTAGDGMFGACGYVPSTGHLARLSAFMENTQPPRPVSVDTVLVVDYMPFEDFKSQLGSEPRGAANGSQPVRSGTNSTSSAAGPRH